MKKGFLVFSVCLMAVCMAATQAMAVNVYAEGAYTNDNLVVYIYADVDVGVELRSAGVKMTYNSTILGDTPVIDRNPEWFLGDGLTNYPYADPNMKSNSGEVVLICGKLDTSDVAGGSTAIGVGGDRVLLGRVIFARNDQTDPNPEPESFFGITLGLGVIHPEDPVKKFDNFVDTLGNPLDGSVDFASKGVIIRERGDANADKSVTPADMLTVRNAYYGGLPLGCEAAADCNNDSTNLYPNVTPADMICIRNKYYLSP